ncbi:MAG TPA: translocation/assembly module TamB domain-containing protein [Thermoanaerobaculia bacterium]|nr:translocation/assembly module TamB domain-containing protein [Thermoanaerobaculia bacterium]
MNVDDPADPLLPPPKGHHRSARERQRKGPMWGCLKSLVFVFGGAFLLLFLIFGGGWWYVGTTNFAELVKLRIEETLEGRLERDVYIGKVTIVRTRPQKVILDDLRIANAPGGVAPWFATVRQVEIFGGVESFWRRRVKLGRVEIRDPQLFFEVFPAGAPLVHNFPKWKTGPKRRYEIVRLDIDRLVISNGEFGFLDRKHDIEAVAGRISSEVTVTRAGGLYEGLLTSPVMRVRLQDYEPFEVDLRGGFRYTPGVLALRSIAMKGRGIEMFLSGQLNPLTEGVYNLRIDSRLALERVREIFRVEKRLEGELVLDTHLRGRQGEFRLSGGWIAPSIGADTYDLTNAKGTLDLNDETLTVDVEKAGYGGGTIGAHYVLSKYEEPYPMTAGLRYAGISIEQLFSDWTIENTGLRSAATGELTYRWNKDKILEGGGEGSAQLSKNARAFSNARYPIPIGGSVDFGLDNGTVTFRRAELDTDASHVSLTGTLKIEEVITDLQMAIRSSDFSELDRIGYNFAHAADKKDYELLGLGGAGTINGTVKGPIDKPHVVAQITGSATRYNEVLLGGSDIDLRYNGDTSTLTFQRATFTMEGGRPVRPREADGTSALRLNGDVVFLDQGGPRFDLALDANGYPAQRAIDAVGLDLKIGAGLATGRMVIAGTPEDGRATFANLVVRRADATLTLNGTVHWMPGEGNVEFDLAIAANNFPVEDIAAFLDFADVPASGRLTGTLRIAGRKESLEGSGKVTVREGAIMGEPVESASADIVFTEGRMRATNVIVTSVAGEIRGEAELDFATEKFSYTIASSSIDLSRLKLLEGLKDLLGGTIVLKSTGAGTFEQPELVVEATLEGATLRGLDLPEGAAPPSLYLAIRNGRLIVRGSVADIVTIEGEGSVGENMAVDGLVRVTVTDIARAVALSPKTSSLPASGNLVVDLKLGGQLTPIEALVIEGSAPVFNLKIADHEFVLVEDRQSCLSRTGEIACPPLVTLRNGRVTFDAFALRSEDSTFAVTGFADVIGEKRIDAGVRGRVEAALLQLFIPDMRAEGHADVAVSVGGALGAPRVNGVIELVDAEVKFAGFPQLIDEINGTLRFAGDRLTIESVRATVGGGTVVAGGFITLDGMTPKNVRITLQGTEVALRYYEGITVEGNFTLLLTGDLERATLTGDVAVTRALYFRDFDVQQTLLNVILTRSRVSTVAAATWQDRVSLNIRLLAPDTLAVNNNIAEVTGSAELEVRGTLATPVILGEVTLDEGGTVRIQNVDYRLVRGTIAFQNPFRIDPFFDVTVEGTVQGGISEIESGPLDLTVNLTGTLDRLQTSVTSDPPASDISLFSILGLGQLGSRAGGAQPGALMGQSLLYQSLGNLIGSRVFPFVDSFTFDPNLLDTGGGPGAKVTFEKRLSDDIRFLIVYNLGNNESKQVVEWIVNRNWTLQLTRDESDEYRLDARFRRRYDAHWGEGESAEEDFAVAARMVEDGRSRPSGQAGLPVLQTSPPPTTRVDAHALGGATIARVDFRADARFDTTVVADEVTLKPGQPITVREVQSSIKNLFATGNFRDIRVDAAPGDGGAVLTFSLFLNYRIGDIVVVGLTRADRDRAVRELTIRTGDVLSLDEVDGTATAIQETLERNGFLEATVDPETEFDRARSIAAVTFHVTPGPLAKIVEITIEGDTRPYEAPSLVGPMRRRKGDVFHLRDARSDAERVKKALLRRGHRRADVDFVDYTYDPATQGVTLRYRVSVGPKVRVEVTGVPRRAVRRYLPFRGRNDEYSEDAVERAADEIVRAYQQRGHFHASVDTESRLENSRRADVPSAPADGRTGRPPSLPNEWITTFDVHPGVRYTLAEVTFSGNTKKSDKELNEVVATSARGGFRRLISTIFRRPRGVTREQLSDDRDAVESHYRLQGFSDATVATPVVATNDAAGTMTVDFAVTEGPQTIVAEVKIEGNEKFDAGALPNLQLETGEPLNPQLHHEDVVALQTFYADRGYVEVQVAPRVAISDDKTSAKVAYAIAEGPRVNIDEVIVRGNTYTHSEVVERTSDLDPGDPFSYTAILEAQRALYRLGIFQRVDIQPEQAGTTVGDRDIVIHVEEGKNLTLTGSIGLRAERGQESSTAAGEPEAAGETAGVTAGGERFKLRERFALGVAHRNLFGTGRYLGLETVHSRDENEFFLTYREPFISRWDVPIQVQVYQADDGTRPQTHILQRGTKIEAAKIARLRTRWSAIYEYKISKCVEGDICDLLEEEPDEPVEGLDRSLLNIQISSIAPTFFWDTRDDIIDPHRGFFTSASIEYAFPFISAKAHFFKGYVQGAYYFPLSSRQVLALSGRVGQIRPRGDTTHETVPLSERFTGGGENTHRAFPLDLLGNLCVDEDEGPDCEATLHQETLTSPILPLGGSGLLLFNAEYRFPIFGTLGGAVFADAGNVYKRRIKFDDLRYGVGFGLRYLSPVGPLRIDVGWPLDRRSYERSFSYFITLGYAF